MNLFLISFETAHNKTPPPKFSIDYLVSLTFSIQKTDIQQFFLIFKRSNRGPKGADLTTRYRGFPWWFR